MTPTHFAQQTAGTLQAIAVLFPEAQLDDLHSIADNQKKMVGYLAATHDLTPAETAEILELRLPRLVLPERLQAA